MAESSSSSSSPSKEKKLCVDVNQAFQNCLSAAKSFAASRNGTFMNAICSAKKLFQVMTICESLKTDSNDKEFVNQFLYLKSQEITTLVLEGICGSTQSSKNQIEATNQSQDDYILSKILQLSTIWCLEYVCPHEVATTLDECLEKCSKGFTAKLTEKCLNEWDSRGFRPRVRINIVTFPKPQYSQKNHWFDFKFEDTKETVPISINIRLNTDRILRHATSVKNAIEILKNDLVSDSIRLTGKEREGCLTPLVWCGLELTNEELEKIPDKPKKYVLENRYGGVIFKFSVDTTRIEKVERGFILATREYIYEFSQALLIPKRKSLAKFYGYNTGNEICELKLLADVTKYDWKLCFASKSGNWTHPEVVFAENLKVLKKKLRIYFVGHSCMKERECDDCENEIQTEKRTKKRFDELLKANPALREQLVWKNDIPSGYYEFCS